MSNSHNFEGFYLTCIYEKIIHILTEVNNLLISKNIFSEEFLENNETDIIAKTYATIKKQLEMDDKHLFRPEAIHSLVLHNASVILAHSLLHNDLDENDINPDKLIKTIDYVSDIINIEYYCK